MFYSICFFCVQYEKKSVAILHDTPLALAAAGTMIGEAGQLVLVNLPDLRSCATPVVPELGWKGMRKPSRSGRRRSLLDPCTSPSRILVAPPVAARHLA
jgi:hypothetical protein